MTTAIQRGWMVTKILLLRLRFIFIFVAIALLVTSWGRIMGVVDRLTRPAKADEMVRGEFEYYCPMHPSVIRPDASQNCPICGMPLSKRRRGEQTKLPEGILYRLQLSPYRIRQAGLATEEITYRTLVREIRTVGTLEWDEGKLAHISARVAGRADELFIPYAGVRVKKGDPVYSLYSPDLVTTQEEYLLALKALEEMKEPDAVERAKRLVDSARERLHLWGINDEQLAELQKSKKALTHLVITSPISGLVIAKEIHAGHYVAVGEDPYTIVDDSVVWVQAEIFERDLSLVKMDQEVEITTEAYPGEAFTGRVSFIQPTLQSDTRTVKVRVEAVNREAKLKPGMYVSAVLRIPLGRRAEMYYDC